jgi:pimeloyl-ACP methyl ester carboxylesterase
MTQFITNMDGNRLGYRLIPGTGPTLIFLPGYMSDMSGSKASALADWAQQNGRACLLFDYRGCGLSDGDFTDYTLEDWRDDVVTMLDRVAPPGPAVLIGSSMGGWLMLLAALARPARIAGRIGIAAAPDFTAWNVSPAQSERLARERIVRQPSAYGGELVMTHDFWASGQRNLVLDQPIALTCPVRLRHGQADDEVPWQISLQLAERLTSQDVQLSLIKAGDHRLSRPQDIAGLLAMVAELIAPTT